MQAIQLTGQLARELLAFRIMAVLYIGETRRSRIMNQFSISRMALIGDQAASMLAALLLSMLLPISVASAANHNGFDSGDLAVVKVGERDVGQAALFDVEHVSAPTDWSPDTVILGLIVDGQAVAYPVAILMWHWIINDTIKSRPVMVVFCRFCGSGAAYGRTVADATLTFGSSGLVYDDDMLLYDRETESLWSWGVDTAVSGPHKNRSLDAMRSEMTTLGDWMDRNPESLIVVPPGAVSGIDYSTTPNGTSASGESVFSGLQLNALQIHPGTPVVGVAIGDTSVAVPATEVLLAGGTVTLEVGEKTLTIAFDAARQLLTTTGDARAEITNLRSWRKAHPDSFMYTAELE